MKKLLTTVFGLAMVFSISVGSISASSTITPSGGCGPPGPPPYDICLERP